MTPETRELITYLGRQPHEAFAADGRIDGRRYLARQFSKPLPLLFSLQEYPGWRHLVGDNWMHWHDYYELFIALSGHGEVVVGNDRFSFASGDIVIVEPLKLHGVVRMEESHTALVILFHAGAVATELGSVERSFLDAWDRRPARALPRLPTDHPAINSVHAAMLNFSKAWFEKQDCSDRLVRLKFHFLEILFHLRRGFASRTVGAAETPVARSERESRLRRALQFVSANAHRSLTQPEVARAIGMSTSRFREFFKQTTGWRFGDYLRDLRLDRASRLLRETDESVAVAAQVNGFADQSHLQRLFKAKYAISPLAYRRQHRARMAAGEMFKK